MSNDVNKSIDTGELKTWMEHDMDKTAKQDLIDIIWAMSKELKHDPAYQVEIQKCRTLAASKTRPTRRSKPMWLWAGVTAASLAIFIVGLIQFRPAAPSQIFTTDIGEQRFITLQDGSTVSINTDTELLVIFLPDSREITMTRGEASFNVAHDAERPFEVHAANGVTRAVGTAFNILMSGRQVSVAVLEGVVAVQSDGETDTPAVQLQIGDAVDYSAGGLITPVRKANLERIRAWEEKKIYFDETPLTAMVAEYNRYSKKHLVLGNNIDRDITVSGVFRIGNLDSLLFTLQEVFNISYVEENNRIILIQKNAQPSSE